MKQAISYIRISNKDQSNFSLSGQQEQIKLYCERKDIRLINSFLDNGQSAKNFDRADWKKLEDFVKANHKDIDHLIVVKYDRFSRNVSDGLNMIDRLERKYNITILSVFEEMHIDPKSPFFFKMRTDMLVQAEFELRVIRDRTKFGINQAKREGRWVTRAPYGYRNEKDDSGKGRIIIEPEKSIIVKRIFELFNEGTARSVILKSIKDSGFSMHSNSALTRILTCPVYVGLIPLNGELVKGSHEPIISMQTFNKAQTFFKKESNIKVILNDEVPLRGVLKCSCGRFLTAGRSKGRGGYYWYYKCKSHLEINLNAKLVHDKIKKVLFDLSLSEQTIDKIRMRSEEKLREALNKKADKVPDLKRQITELEKKILMLEEKFILNQLNFQTYSNWNSAYNTDLNILKSKLAEATDQGLSIWTEYKEHTGKLTDMLKIYESLDTAGKQRLLKLLFNSELQWRLNSFLTNNIIDIFEANALKLKEKGLLVLNSPPLDNSEITISSGNGRLVELFELIRSVKIAA